MKRLISALALGIAALSTPAFAADVGVSVSIGQPGFYGRLDIGGFPAPALLYPRPVMVQRVPRDRPPLYLRVPPNHAKHWKKYCSRYRACGERVYFVQDGWYNREYAPRYREQHGNNRRDVRGERRNDRQNFREERRDNRQDFRGERRDNRQDFREERRDNRRDSRNDRRGGGDNGRGRN